MPRPPNADPEETYDRVQTAAMHLLLHQGMQAVTVRAVAQQAGVAVGTVRYYFASKKELLEACLDAYQARLADLGSRVLACLRASPDPRAVLASAARAAFALLDAQQPMARLRLTMTAEQGELTRGRRAQAHRAFLDESSAAISRVSGTPVDKVRLGLDTIVRVAAFYASCSPEEAMDVTRTSDAVEAKKRLLEHTIDLADKLFFAP